MAIDLVVNEINRMSGVTYIDSPSGKSLYQTHSAYAENMASACFNSFFSYYRGVNSGSTSFDWLTFSGTFENQIYKLYGENASKNEPWPTPEPESAAASNITIKMISQPGDAKKMVKIANSNLAANTSNTGSCYLYGSAITEVVYDKFFNQNTSPLNPVYNKNNITKNFLFSAFSSSLLTIMEGKIYNDITDSSMNGNFVSGYVGYVKQQQDTIEVNINDYIKSAATWVYDKYLGPTYIWNGEIYNTVNSNYSYKYRSFIDYKYSGASAGLNDTYASGWIGVLRSTFHNKMNSLINEQN